MIRSLKGEGIEPPKARQPAYQAGKGIVMDKDAKFLIFVTTIFFIAVLAIVVVVCVYELQKPELIRIEESVMTRIEQPLYYLEQSIYTKIP